MNARIGIGIGLTLRQNIASLNTTASPLPTFPATTHVKVTLQTVTASSSIVAALLATKRGTASRAVPWAALVVKTRIAVDLSSGEELACDIELLVRNALRISAFHVGQRTT
jgi:hypothetical protein